jgi:glycosyltransferase involved in cell wall biosynthesis
LVNGTARRRRARGAFASIAAVPAERHLFIAGCPRSGTSALTFLLNEHPALAIGFERYKRLRAQLDPFHFTPAQFLAPVRAETDIRGELLYARLRARLQSGSVTVIGDKVPLYTRVLPLLLDRFAQARAVVLVRDPLAVARSFRRRAADPRDWWPAENDHTLALSMWNEALAAVRAVEGEPEGDFLGEGRVALLPYERFFSGEQRLLEMLAAFVGVPPTSRLRAEYLRLAVRGGGVPERPRGGDAERERPDDELAAYVDAHRDAALARWADERIARQLDLLGPPAAAGPEEDEAPLSAEEIAERERERAQLLDEMRRPGQPAGDELEILERRYVEQARELARRGERPGGVAGAAGVAGVAGARTPRPGGSTPLGAPVSDASRLRLTFIAPHQRATSGGVYVIEQLARHLAAAQHDVCLAVRQPPTRSLPGVRVVGVEHLHGGEGLPPADVLLYPADLRDADAVLDLPARAGRPVMLFQGYGTPGSPVVQANLAAAREAVAIARWLADLALARGIPCAYVPQGLDRSVFAPGPPPAARAPVVSVMTHHLDWKGLDDALAALTLVRARRPDVQVTLFGGEPVAGVESVAGIEGGESVAGLGAYVANPSRPAVAELLRRSAVHLVASWEEGFGLAGAEAIACGAALASTDTKGSRDYALDGRTALVSPPRDPAALARNVLRLLDDVELRARLVAAGQRHLRTVMPPWPEVARRRALALGEG